MEKSCLLCHISAAINIRFVVSFDFVICKYRFVLHLCLCVGFVSNLYIVPLRVGISAFQLCLIYGFFAVNGFGTS